MYGLWVRPNFKQMTPEQALAMAQAIREKKGAKPITDALPSCIGPKRKKKKE